MNEPKYPYQTPDYGSGSISTTPAQPSKDPGRFREIIDAQHDETGRMWTGPRGEIPPRYYEVQRTSNPSDVLDRLRRARALLVELGITYPTNPSLYGEAADEIERLREELHPPSKPLLAHYEAVYKALNEFRPVTGTEDWVAVRLKALGLLLDNHPSKFRAADETAASLNKESVIKSSADDSSAAP